MTAFSRHKTESKCGTWAVEFINLVGHFLSDLKKIGRGFIKILETWQFGLSFNIIRHVFFCFGQKKNLCRFYEFLKNFDLAQKKIIKSRYWL
jgi:hypothetical protein